MAVFMPDLIVNNVMKIDKKIIQRYGIKALILDVDNTLTTHGHPEPYAGVVEWLNEMRANNIKMMISSNNTRKRVEPFAGLLELDFLYRSLKPLPYGIGKAVKKFGLNKKQVAIVGDQIYTDIIGGNLAGIRTFLVEPFELETGKAFRFKRFIEKPWIKRYYKKKVNK